MTKIITKQITNKDVINKSRHLTGLHRWSRSSSTIGFIMLVMEWFTIPFEIVFRRDFGQRWLTAANFVSGGLLLGIFWGLQYGWVNVSNANASDWFGYFKGIENFSFKAFNLDSRDSRALVALTVIICLYVLLGCYQLFKMKWRNQVNIPLHSFDDGTSRLLWLGAILKWILNAIATPVMIILWLFFPPKQRRGKPFPKLISDNEAFTNVFIEPGIAISMGIIFWGIASFYFFVSGLSMFMHAHWKEMARKSKMLDFQDSKLEAEMMKELRNAAQRSSEIVAKAKAKIRQQSPKTPGRNFDYHPRLAVIIEELHNERSAAK